MFFGLNAYMGALLEQRGQGDRLAESLFWFNLAQVAASLVMLKMARAWVGRRSLILIMAVISIAGTTGTLLLPGWWAIASATLMSFVAGILLILLVALPPLLVSSEQTGQLSAGNFLVGYTLAFAVPMAGGLIADWTGNVSHAVVTMVVYSILVLPLIFTLDLTRK
ncbi:unnamed protein product, partial [Ectocarpus sp. 12 AP-2014]